MLPRQSSVTAGSCCCYCHLRGEGANPRPREPTLTPWWLLLSGTPGSTVPHTPAAVPSGTAPAGATGRTRGSKQKPHEASTCLLPSSGPWLPGWQGSLESELVGLTLNMPEGLSGAESQSISSMHSIAWFVDMGRRKAYFIESKIQLIEDEPQNYAPLRKTNSQLTPHHQL